MPRTLCKSDNPMYLNTFPSWKGRQPFRFFVMENLLEARRDSQFPTNGAGPDEDVNVFLAGLLTRFLRGGHDAAVVQGAACVLLPPPADWSRRRRVNYYLANANHRLLHLGLLDRGDGLRRRPIPFGFTREESRQRDLAAGAACYDVAANLAEGRGLYPEPLVAVWRKLALNFTDHVHVLGVLATRRLGLGARLDDAELAQLGRSAGEKPEGRNREGEGSDQEKPNRVRAGTSDRDGMDHFLDQLSRYRARPDAQTERSLWIAARRMGVDASAVISGTRRT